jgi:8-oxo-dGTP pyrophosphatase MutT (NUDIX family)
VAIAAVIDDRDRVLMMWRYRFVPDSFGWELPGGIVDEGEDSLQTALREVEEETDWRPDSLEHVLSRNRPPFPSGGGFAHHGCPEPPPSS